MYFESHAHYDDNRYDSDRTALLEELPRQGVDYVVNAGADMDSTRQGLLLAQKYDYIYSSAGVHPHEAKSLTGDDITELEKYCGFPKTVAVGEIGLDYHYDNSPREIQRHWFIEQLNLCVKTGLPVIIHSRDADAETFEIIKQSKVRRGVIHCYSGSAAMAKEYVKMGFYIGVGGVVTFPKARKLIETVETVPLDKILIETDCPYLSPVPHRGERNSSINLKYICQRVADIKGISIEEAADATKNNGLTLFSKIMY